ncbi:MAG: hypothetical protein K6C36_09820 [Clostridia bacterium]|nr:hypothetical protein [Clostridia bacterium]
MAYCAGGDGGSDDMFSQAYCVASSTGKITLNGGTYAYFATNGSAGGTGTSGSYGALTRCGMVAYKDTIPTINDATTAPVAENADNFRDTPVRCYWYNDDHGDKDSGTASSNAVYFTNYCVSKISSATTWNQMKPMTRVSRHWVYPENEVATVGWNTSNAWYTEEGTTDSAHTSSTVITNYYATPSVGEFYVDDGTTKNTDASITWATSNSNGAAAMTNGYPAAYNSSNVRSNPARSRVHVLYRIWNSAGTQIDSTSYAPFTGASLTQFSNAELYNSNYYWRTDNYDNAAVTVDTNNPGGAINTNYYIGLDKNAGDADASLPKVTIFTSDNYATVDLMAAHSNDGASRNVPVYVFIDYKQIDARNVAFENVGDLTFNYTGEEFGPDHTVHGDTTMNSVKVKYAGTTTEITSLVSNSFNFYNSTGIRKACLQWRNNSSDTWKTSNYPKNAGTYLFRIYLADDKSSPDNANSLNINSASAEFSVTIEKIAPTGFPDSVSVTYGDAVSTADLSNIAKTISGTTYYKAQKTGLYNNATETPAGTLSFLSGSGIVTASGTTQVTWTPAAADTVAANYKTAQLTLSYNMAKRAITISVSEEVDIDYATSAADAGTAIKAKISVPEGASDGSNSSGLAPRDSGLVTNIISNLTIQTYSATLKPTAAAHNATDPIGTYDVILSGGTYSNFNTTNYSITYADNTGKLVIGKKTITAVLSTEARDYNALATGKVNFALSGTVSTDDVYVKAVSTDSPNTAWATFSSADAGTRSFSSWLDATPTLQGAAANNYTLSFSTTGLTLTINKLTSQVYDYNFAGQTYHFGRTLNDIAASWTIEATDLAHPAGTFTWTDGSIVPTASVNRYYATFTPASTTNYTVRENCLVIMTVEKGVISVSGTLQNNPTDTITYGDAAPTYDVVYTVANANEYETGLYADGDAIKNSSGTTVLTKIGSPEISSSYVQFSDAGSYAMTVALNGADDSASNYRFVADNTASFTVAKKTITATGPDSEVTYGTAYNLTGDVTVEGIPEGKTLSDITSSGTTPVWSLSTVYSISDASNRGAGTYDIDVDLADLSDNYDLDVVPGTLTVLKKDMTIAPRPVSVTYSSPAPTFTYRLTDLADFESTITDISALAPGSAFELPDFDANPRYTSSTNVGQYNIELYNEDVVTGDDYLLNYNVIYDETVVKLTVTAKRITVTDAMTGTITYGETYGDAVFNTPAQLSGIAGTWSFTGVDLASVPAWTNRGASVAAAFTPASQNYTVDAVTATLAINRRALSGTLIINGSAMVGELLAADFSAVEPALTSVEQAAYISYQWNGAPATADPTTLTRSTLVLTNDYEGHYLTLTITANDSSDDCPYTGTLTSDVTAKICPKLNKLTLAQLQWSSNETTWVHNGAAFTPADYAANYGAQVVYNAGQYFVYVDTYLTGANCVGAITVKYNGLTTAPSAAGSYNVTIDVAALPQEVLDDVSPNAQNEAVNSNGDLVYGPVSGLLIGTLTIEKAPLTVTFTAADKVYDGETAASATAAGFTVTGVIGSDDVDIIEELVELNFASVDVGENIAVTATGGALQGNKSSNYTFTFGSSAASITPRTITAKVVATGRVYDGTNTLTADHISFINFGEDSNYPLADRDSTDDEDAFCVYINDGASAVLDSANVGSRSISSFNGLSLGGTVAGNYELVILNQGTVRVKITQATPNVLTPSFTGVYDAGATLDGDYVFAVDGWTWVDGSVTPQAGRKSYAAVYAVPGDTAGNYKTLSRKVVVELDKRAITFTAVPAATSVVYGSARPTINATYVIAAAGGFAGSTGTVVNNVLPDGISGNITVNCTYNAGSDVGTYPVSLGTTLFSSNYSITYQSASLTVTKREVTTTASAAGREYDGTTAIDVYFSALSNVYADDTVYLTADAVTATLSSANAGSRTVTFGTAANPMPTLSGTKAGNYKLTLTNPTLTVVITKAEASGFRFPTTATMNFGEVYSQAVLGDSEPNGGSFALADPNGTPDGAGNYQHTVIYTPADAVNYATSSSTLLLTVNKVDLANLVDEHGNPLVIRAVIYSTLKAGETARCTVTNLPSAAAAYAQYNWYVVSNPDAAAAEATSVNYIGSGPMVTISSSYVGKYLYCEVNCSGGDSPFTGVFTAVSGEIQEEHLTFWQRLWKWIQSIIHAITTLTSHV